jgi:predicted RNA-binding protein with PUA-like domain
MARWLFKQEPDCYSFADLLRDSETVWDGITNALALIHLRQCMPGDLAFYYHTGKEKAIVGIAGIIGAPTPDPNLDDDKLVVVQVKAVRALAQPVSLATIKADPLFAEWELVRNSRLSVMPCPDELWNRVLELAGETAEVATPKKTKKPR